MKNGQSSRAYIFVLGRTLAARLWGALRIFLPPPLDLRGGLARAQDPTAIIKVTDAAYVLLCTSYCRIRATCLFWEPSASAHNNTAYLRQLNCPRVLDELYISCHRTYQKTSCRVAAFCCPVSSVQVKTGGPRRSSIPPANFIRVQSRWHPAPPPRHPSTSTPS